LEDALAAINAGADYLGFNFYPKSPRYLTPERCADIQSAIRHLPSAIRTVGIFVNESPEHVRQVMTQCGLDLAQLHGEESPETVTALNGRAFKAFRGIGERHGEFAAARKPSPRATFGCPPLPSGEGNAPALLIDAYSATHYGGTGQITDWDAAHALAARFPLMLAGGLTPENVADAIARVQPWGVDVASGVEAAPGKKDHSKVRLFVERAKGAGEQAGG
ncbi:MAG: phosphoribosylanthranilate isomerase, partial [Anaerolineales bacterium]